MDNLFYCNSFPCHHQEPKVYLQKIDERRYECPMCELVYNIDEVQPLSEPNDKIVFIK